MSIVPKETIEAIAQSIGISNLSPEVALALAPDVEYRVRDIMQEAIKCMRHSKRTILTADDVNSALNLRNVEPIYGFASGDPLGFKQAVGHKDLFYIDDKDGEFKDVIEAPTPKAPLDTAVVAHWLAIEGVQPAIPENASVEDNRKPERKEDGLPVEIKLPIKHVLSRELQLYFAKIRELTLHSSDTVLFKEALASLATDSGLHPLVPYFTHLISNQVTRSLNDFPHLFALMRVVRSLLQNPHIRIEPYLHQLMPCVLTCLVTKRLGNRLSDNHWELRNFTAELLASICKRFGHVYHKLQQPVTDILLSAFLDPTKAMTQHYGAIEGLATLGPGVIRLLILPNLEPYLQLLEPEMLLEKQKNEMKRNEAWHVYGALLCAAGLCMYERLKLFPSLLSPPAHTVWRTNRRVVAAMPNKRKMSVEHTAQQPPLKRVIIEGSMGGLSAMPMQTDNMQSATDVFPATSRDSVFGGPLQSFRQVTATDSNSRDSSRRQKGEGRAPRISATLAQAWKEDMDTGDLLASLFDLFGESILPFTPSAELAFFL